MTNGSFLRNSISPHAPRARRRYSLPASSPPRILARRFTSLLPLRSWRFIAIYIYRIFSPPINANNDPQILRSTFSSLAFRMQFFFLAPIDFDDDRRRRRRRPVDSSTSSVSMNEGGNISAGISATGIIMFAPLSLPSSIDFRNYFVYTVVM